ncbi:hypothetical protein AB0N65_11325 [Paenarthrobacter sp. NPDC089322]|uniref:hypothetical protein n=1 Tax=Paenarthrobacter sp. NPDC089322 TaxID=3155065 RepID=UPI00343463F7
MTLNETIARIRAGHLMVRDAAEWDELSANLARAYQDNDDEGIEQLRPPFLQSWRTVTRYVLRDTFDAAGINVAEPSHPWGIAILSANGASCEPVLGHADGEQVTSDGRVDLLTFEDTMANYARCLGGLLPD